MPRILNRSWAGDPEHSVLPHPSQYEIVDLHLHLDPIVGSEAYLDVTFRGRDELRVLRFWSPRNLEIDEGGPSTIGMIILDVSARQLDGVAVRVDNYEGSGGAIRFVARGVEVVEAPSP